MRSLSSLVLAAMVIVALLWGNCAQCASVVPAAKRDCCDQQKNDCQKQDCTVSPVDLAKAMVSAHHYELAPPAAPAIPLTEPAPGYTTARPIAAVPAYSPPDVWLLDSAILI